MELFIYIIIFITGTFLGSFCTLAIHRIPLKQNITYERSYCPNCTHKLVFFDLFPVFSYIFLRGKCRYCHKKIRPRYFIIEIFSGILLVLFAISVKVNIFAIQLNQIIYLVFGTIYFITLILVAGIDKEYITVQKSVITWGIAIYSVYILYLYRLGQINLYKYGICLFIILLLTIISTLKIKKQNKTSYTLDILLLFIYMTMFSNMECMLYTVALGLYMIGIKIIINNKNINLNKIPIGFYLAISNICILLTQNFLIY